MKRLDLIDVNQISANAITVEYPNDTTEIYKWRTGGLSGTVVLTITIVYVNNTKNAVSSVVRS